MWWSVLPTFDSVIKFCCIGSAFWAVKADAADAFGSFSTSRSSRSRQKRFLSDNEIGIDRPSFWKKIRSDAVSITAPKARKTLLAIKNGVSDGTTITFIHCWPIGKKTARLPVTVLLLPNRKLTAQGASCIRHLTDAGRALQSSSNCFRPITDILAPKSTIPEVPCDTKLIHSVSWSTMKSLLVLRGSCRGTG